MFGLYAEILHLPAKCLCEGGATCGAFQFTAPLGLCKKGVQLSLQGSDAGVGADVQTRIQQVVRGILVSQKFQSVCIYGVEHENKKSKPPIKKKHTVAQKCKPLTGQSDSPFEVSQNSFQSTGFTSILCGCLVRFAFKSSRLPARMSPIRCAYCSRVGSPVHRTISLSAF